MRCRMCNIWGNPSDIKQEFRPEILRRLPRLALVNVTGGEPLIRDDLDEIIGILFTKTKRVVVSTSGWFEQKTLRLAQMFPGLGFRVSIEGLSQKNDELRGQCGGFDRGLRVLVGLRRMGIKDIGFGITVSNNNSADMLWLYELARQLRLEYATATLHNSFYFHKYDNVVTNVDEVCRDFEELANRLMKEPYPKSWFRSLFNVGLINYIRGKPRMLPCEAGSESFFVDPFGEILPCNGMEKQYWYATMGNLSCVSEFRDVWESVRAQEVRRQVATCPKYCWMIGSASPVMKKYFRHLLPWVVKHKLRSLAGKRIRGECCPHYDVGQGRDPRRPICDS